MILIAVAIVFLLLYALLFVFFFRGWKAAGQELDPAAAHSLISVVVAARNEERHLPALFEALRNQDYPPSRYEIIIADDHSTDATAKITSESGLSNVRLVQPEGDARSSSKKKAIEAGIRAARGELVLTTDADCLPPARWLSSINAAYRHKQANFIAAPVKFLHDGSLLQVFQSIDFLTLQGITAAVVATDSLTMCNGANLAYARSAFFEAKGFDGIDKIATGDDMLLMYKIRQQDPSRIHYLKSKEAIVSTWPMKSWKDFLMQRRRWASKALVYDDKRIVAILFFVYFFNLFFLAAIVASLLQPFYWWLVAGFWLLKTFIEWPFVRSVARFYEEQGLMRYFFLLQPLHMFYTVFIGLYGQMGKYEWKGRKTK